MKLLAIDGNSIINRAFYGIKLLTTKDGQYTNGVYGFINILNRLLEAESPDAVAVAFDLNTPTFRHKKYVQYKAGRHKTPMELVSQFPILKEWLKLAGYKCVECEGYEADDILGTLALSAENSGNTCVIATGDRDSLQLVSEKTRVLLAATKMDKPEIISYDPAALFEKYSLTPPEMIELKALMGDASDHIPGVAGVGEKTATDLITRYHDIDYIYKNIDKIDIKESVRAKLAAGKDFAYLSRELGTICRYAPIDTDMSDYVIRPRDSRLAPFMAQLEFFKLMEKMGISADSAAVAPKAAAVNRKLTVIPENSLVDGRITVWIDDNSAAVVSNNKCFKCDLEYIKALLTDNVVEKYVYDYKSISKRYETENIAFDAMLAGYLCNPAANSYSLDRLAAEYGAVCPEFDGEADDVIRSAALLDAVCPILLSALRESGQEKLLHDIEIPLAKVLGEMENAGFLVDVDGLRKMGNELSEKISVIEQEIYKIVGNEFNLNSPKQLGKALFEDMGITPAKKTKSGYSTSADILEKLQYDFPVVRKILEYRKLSKLKSTYCDGLLSCVSPDDGRIHSTFNQTEARTGRISSLEPNLQNIPVRTEEGRKLREYFIAPDGYVLCDADYSQIELRVLASVANDENMIKAFNSDTDIHTVTASQVFGMPADMITPELRRRAKAVNFGIIYGIGAFSLSQDIGVSRKEAEQYIKGYLAAYPGVSRYMDEVIENAKLNGYVSTVFGRRRYLPELSASNHMIRSFGERAARNAPIQGAAADIIKIAMINVSERLRRELPDSRLILQVHDELIVECPKGDAAAASEILQNEMENAVKLSVRMKADVHSGKNWLEAKG